MLDSIFALFDDLRASLGADFQKQLDVRIAIVGLTGVGKTATCNALLGSNWRVGHTTATTRHTAEKQLVVNRNGREIDSCINVTDFPGLGESIARDRDYVPLYREQLRQFDAVLWVAAANNREMAPIQSYLNQLAADDEHFHRKVVIALNKADLVEPMSWNPQSNLPSAEQEANIAARIADVVKRLNEVESQCKLPSEQVIAFSAKQTWRVWALFQSLSSVLAGPKKMSLERFASPQAWSTRIEASTTERKENGC